MTGRLVCSLSHYPHMKTQPAPRGSRETDRQAVII